MGRRSPANEAKIAQLPRLIIGFAGRKQSGKDTAGSFLVQKGFTVFKFADPLKNMMRAFLASTGMEPTTIEQCVEGGMKEIPLTVFGGRSPRFFMQRLGNEFGRGMIWDDLWINALKIRVSKRPLVVITDVRSQREVDAIRKMKGKVIRITNKRCVKEAGEHESESGIDHLKVDDEISNDGTLDQLHDKVKKLIVGMSLDLSVEAEPLRLPDESTAV